MSSLPSKSAPIPSSGVLVPIDRTSYADPSFHQGVLLSDRLRNNKFRQAIFNTVKRGDIVIDIGTGTGILAFYAVEAGARRVYAIEQHKNMLDIAREEAKKRGVADKIQFIHANFIDLPPEAIPQKVDVVVSEMIAVFGLEEAIIPLMQAAQKFIKPEGKFIPQSLSLFIVPVQTGEQLQQKIIPPCKLPIIHVHINSLSASERAGISYLGDPQKLLSIGFGSCNLASMKSQLQFKSLTKASLYGLCGWFEAWLDRQTLLSNSPHCPAVHWSQTIFKLPTPFLLQEGDVLTIRFKTISESRYTLFIFDLSNSSGKNARISGLFQH